MLFLYGSDIKTFNFKINPMKKTAFSSLVIACLLLAYNNLHAQDDDRLKQELSLRHEIEETKGNSEKLKAYIKLMGVSNDTTLRQFSSWMKQYPDSASFP